MLTMEKFLSKPPPSFNLDICHIPALMEWFWPLDFRFDCVEIFLSSGLTSDNARSLTSLVLRWVNKVLTNSKSPFVPRSPPLQFLGRISLQLYLLHDPVLKVAKRHFHLPQVNSGRVHWTFLNLPIYQHPLVIILITLKMLIILIISPIDNIDDIDNIPYW